MRLARVIVALLVSSLACRGAAPAAQSLGQQQLERKVDSLMPIVAKAAGLEFKQRPRSLVRSREQLRTYLLAKLAQELPPARLNGIVGAYRLLGLLPDTLDVQRLFIDLYTEQVAGFYDPDSTALFALEGGDPLQLNLVLAHELVHALQHQYLPLDSIMRANGDGDRLAAAQAIFEGQATLASLVAMLPDASVLTNESFWDTFRDGLKAQQTGNTVYARAPLVVREGLTFPYVQGAGFLRWFRQNHAGEQPYGPQLPRSTEQILHPDRYAAGDQPVTVRVDGDTVGVGYEDTFGEYGIEMLRAVLQRQTDVRTDPAIGWAGDRLRLYDAAEGHALVWIIVWDEPRFAERFRAEVGDPLAKLARPGYRTRIDPLTVGGKAAVRVTIAPEKWGRWSALPVAAGQS